MKHETAIGAQLAAKGILAKTVKLDMALSEFRNHGGTCREALERVSSAFADQGDDVIEFAARTLRAVQLKQDGWEGQTVTADKAGTDIPSSPSTERSTDLERNAAKARPALSVAAPQRDGKGRTHDAAKARDPVPAPVSPRKMPGHAKRGMEAIAAVNKSLFDSYKLPGDDRAIGDITWKELQGLARKHAEAYRLLSLIDGFGQPTNIDAKVRDVLKEGQLNEFVQIARLQNVH